MPEDMSGPLFDCCDHCEHDDHAEEHDTPCDHGCNDDEVDQAEADAEMEAMTDA